MKDYGYFRVAAGVPAVKTAGVNENREGMAGLYHEAAGAGADLVVFPELSLTGYSCADLFSQSRLLDSAEKSAALLAEISRGEHQGKAGNPEKLPPMVFGLPVRARGMLFNCAVFAWDGKILGIVPKTYLPNTHEFYEQRWFASGNQISSGKVGPVKIDFAGAGVPFGTDLLFKGPVDSGAVIGIEICEDLWSPLPPSSIMCLAGASVIVNPSASNELAGKASYRKDLVLQQSARGLAAYAYVSAGVGESTTDTVYGGAAILAENGHCLAEGKRFLRDPGLTEADMDLEFLQHERLTSTSFSQTVSAEIGRGIPDFRIVEWGEPDGNENFLPSEKPFYDFSLKRHVEPKPFVPVSDSRRKERCEEIFSIQSHGLATRLEHIGCSRAVLGLSGGLDSTLALLVTLKAFEILGLDKKGVLSYTMPGFGTTSRTLGNVQKLCALLKIPLETVDIKKACEIQMNDLEHSGTPSDVAYENVQARYRTALLMNKANMAGGIVIGTGDLSELALGWCTYNGDHMSMYAVNTGVPKTLVTWLVEYAADTRTEEGVREVLLDIIGTPISPELLPPDIDGVIAQKTEEVVGPYELHDFFLYQGIRCGFSPAKVFFLAKKAFSEETGKERSEGEILKWLEVFYRRFFSQQFKRSCLPDGPKVGTIALSPRGDWRMPSDASPEVWMKEIKILKEKI